MKGTKPIILAVDDQAPVLSAVLRDLRQRFGREYRLLGARSGQEALGLLQELALRNKTVALMIVDQRMPEMTGVELLKEATALYPAAGRILLTAYADTNAAIRAINEIKLDHYLMKPWDPPEERLYPVVDELLEDWRARFDPPFQGVKLVSHRWSSEGHRIKDYLTRNQIPYRWFDLESDPEAARLVGLALKGGGETDQDPGSRPLVLFPEGTSIFGPSPAELAKHLGIHSEPKSETYDLAIIGAGPAGLAAAVYSASEGLSTLLIEKEAPGGQAGMSSRIENYLGFPSGLSGAELARRALTQAKRFGAEILTPAEAAGIRIEGDYRIVELANGSEIVAQSVLIAAGISYGTLDVPGTGRLSGCGVYYGAALTEAMAIRGQDVFIVGGGNSAGQAAVYLAEFARSVTLLVRRARLTAPMSRYLIDRLEEIPNVHVRTSVKVLEALGDERLEAVRVRDSASGEEETLPAYALFVFVGATARTDWLDGVVERGRNGYVLTGPDVMRGGERPRGWTERRDPFLLEASAPGIFAAGDIRHRSVKRIASAVGEGSMAVQFVHGHLASRALFSQSRPLIRMGA
jgi:thioredoxin reductase (NADPH)